MEQRPADRTPQIKLTDLDGGILSSSRVTLIDHKTGVINLAIRQRRQPFLDRREKLPADLDALLRTKEVSVPWKADTEWHELVLGTENDDPRLGRGYAVGTEVETTETRWTQRKTGKGSDQMESPFSDQ